MATSRRIEDVYFYAKLSTKWERIINLNWPFLWFKNKGMSEKKRWIVTFGIRFRIISVVMVILLLTLVFGFGIFDNLIEKCKEGYQHAPSRQFAAYIEYLQYFIHYAKIPILIFGLINIFYNLFFKIWYQIHFRELMKEDENAHHQNRAQTRIPTMTQSAQSGRPNGAQSYDDNSFLETFGTRPRSRDGLHGKYLKIILY